MMYLRLIVAVDGEYENVKEDLDDYLEGAEAVEGYTVEEFDTKAEAKSGVREAKYDTTLDPISPNFDIRHFIYGD